MASIENVEIYGLDSAIFRSGYSMLETAPTEEAFQAAVEQIRADRLAGNYDNPHIRRAIKLSSIREGGHDQFLTGAVVNFDLTISNKAWVEAERYTFLNFISSMSTMHRIARFKLGDFCNEYTSPAEIAEAERLQDAYNAIYAQTDPEGKKRAYLELLYNLPSGFELMAGMTTNYRALKNIYAQRRNHRLPDWHVVCDWIETLPLAAELITGKTGQP